MHKLVSLPHKKDRILLIRYELNLPIPCNVNASAALLMYQLTMPMHRFTMPMHRFTMPMHRLTMLMYQLTMLMYRLTMPMY